MKFGSVCSGIEAASVAWNPLGFEAAWLSEIEPFPSGVLAYHYPDVPNLGDMTLLPKRILSGEIDAPDLFCGGTPCQAFSVAGKRQSLDDDRGNLSLIFCEIADAIDTVRTVREEQPAIIFWENVPGVLSTKDNAFGCFLAGLAGEDLPLQPAGKKWTNAGVVLGPKRAVAWRVLDAQYFGVAQRRRRVFVVASARDGFDPAAVLFESEGLRRDTAPGREKGKTVTDSIAQCFEPRSPDGHARVVGNISPTLNRMGGGQREPCVMTWPADIAKCLTSRAGSGGGFDLETETGVIGFRDDATCKSLDNLQPTLTRNMCKQVSGVMATLNATDGVKWGSNQWVDEGKAIIQTSYSIQGSMIGRNDNAGQQGDGVNEEVCFTQNTTDRHGVAYGLPGNWIGRKPENGGNAVEPMHDVAPCLTKTDIHGVVQPIVLEDQGGSVINVRQDGTVGTLRRETHGHEPCVIHGTQDPCVSDIAFAQGRNIGGENVFFQDMAVRRLTPTECERLQGFPDGYTNIPWKKSNESPDGPRYKALGNSWAVPVVRWIGRRILNEVSK